MRLLRSSLLLAFITVLCLAQTGTPLANPNVRRVGNKLACLCGACNYSVTSCDMLRCHYSDPARQKIATLVSQNTSDDDIVTSFVKEHGMVAALIPPTSGFYGWSWWMPMVALGSGLCALYFIVNRLRHKPALTPVTAQGTASLSKYQSQIDRELGDD